MSSYEDPRHFLARHELWPKDSFGQCFLIAEPIATAIVSALNARSNETVVEIGTGCGTLARMIAPMAREVLALERDRDLVAALRTERLPTNVQIVETDAGAYDYAEQCSREPTAVVGNLPYQLTGRLVRALLHPPVRWRVAVLMVQKEVAARMLAAPGSKDWSALGVFVTAACSVSRVADASPRCFHPAPRVTSTVLRLEPRPVPLADESPAFQRVVHALFAARRKTVLNGLAAALPGGRLAAAEILSRAGIDAGVRPETLSVEQLGAIAKHIEHRDA